MTNDSHLISGVDVPHHPEYNGRQIRIRLAQPNLGAQELNAVSEVFSSGRLVQGPIVAAFEADLAEFIGVNYAVLVSSGTAALHLALLALDISQGDVLFIPSFAWPSAANMVVRLGGLPIFVDSIAETCNVDPDHLRSRIDKTVSRGYGRPRAIVAVHEFGLACDLDSIVEIANENNLAVIEDAACALGAYYNGKSVGTIGEMGIFSFHPRKSITTGEGGVIVTDDKKHAARLRALRNHGQSHGDKYLFESCGFNYRMTEMQAAIGRVQLGKLGGILTCKHKIASQYNKLLSDVPKVTPPIWNDEHTWQTYMVRLDETLDRDKVIGAMADQGVEVGPGAMAAHRLQMFSSIPGATELAVTEVLADYGLALPMHAGLSESDVSEVVKALCESVSS